MTNDEAIYTLKNAAWLGWDKQKEKVTEAVRMAVEALKRETSGDAISRYNAIDALMEILDRPNHAEFLYTDEICKVLNELPSVQPEPKWIPCKDRLPERGNEVLVCYDFKGHRFVLTGVLYGDGSFHGYDDEYLTPEGRKYRKAVAWMPLPEPYQEEGDSE